MGNTEVQNSTVDTTTQATPDEVATADQPNDRSVRPRRARRQRPRGEYLDTNAAAAKLGMTVHALRALVRRCSRKEAHGVVSRLGAGILGLKVGGSWRFKFTDVV